MTVAVAVCCADGILIASDSASSETVFGFKQPFPRGKIEAISCCGIAYSGNADLCRRILHETRMASERDSSPAHIAARLSKCARQATVFRRSGNAQFVVSGYDKHGAVRMYLITKSERFSVADRSDDGYVAVGRWPVVDYFLARFLVPGMSVSAVARLAMLAIRETAAVLDGIDTRVRGVLVTSGTEPAPFDFAAISSDSSAQEISYTRAIEYWLSSAP
jgi:20S proteasome alpha/beta subunit